MTGGSTSRNSGVLSRAAELEKLHGRAGQIQEQLEAARQEEEVFQRDLAAARYDLETAESQRRRAAGRNSANSPFSAVMRLSS